MGNTDSKQRKSSRSIDQDEAKSLALRLGVKSESDSLSRDQLFQALGWNDMTTSITQLIWSGLHSVTQNTDLKFKHILDFVDGMAFQDQSYTAKYLVKMLGDSTSKESIETFVQDLIRLHSNISTACRISWNSAGVTASESSVALLSTRIVETLETLSAENKVEVVENWLRKELLFFAILRHVFLHLFKLQNPSSVSQLLPQLTSQHSPSPKPSILDINDILFLNYNLPHDMQSEWSLVFSTRLHGMSFTSMLGKLTNKGPTIIILEDCKGHVFGGFASESWHISPKFLGDSRCFLFQIRPGLSIHTSTGYNKHYMYLNHLQQTMPNGLGMGGQLGHFGIWIDADFGKGHSSEGCSTYYHVPTLSSGKEFVIEHIEVWAVGPPPKEDSDDETDGKRSILDKDAGAKALLELVDRGRHSEGLREVPDD